MKKEEQYLKKKRNALIAILVATVLWSNTLVSASEEPQPDDAKTLDHNALLEFDELPPDTTEGGNQ
jgi:hypothetical protein